MADLDLQLVVGSKGDKGDTGAKGDKGDKGDKGEKGEKGATGATGPVGPIGPQGPRGETGATGATGPVGPTGPQGARGEAGPTGATGPQGPAGSGVVESSAAGIIAHVEDAFAGSGILGLTIEGAYSQQTTTGLQLLDAPKTTATVSSASVMFDGEHYTLKNPDTMVHYIAINLSQHIPAGSDGTRYAMYVQGGRSGLDVVLRSGSNDLLYIRDTGIKANETAFITQDIDNICFGIPANTPEFKIKVICAVGSSVTTWEPYTGGKPSPSPDYPQDITVIENPVVTLAGRNLLDITALAKESPKYYKADEGTLTILGTDNRAWATFAATQELKAGTYILSGDFVDLKDVDGNSLSYTNGTVGAPFTLPVDTKVKIKIGYGRAVESYPYASKAMIERSSSASAYAPCSSQTLAFALPAEHPYLAKLPDGTADTIEVDSDGNVTLVARVTKVQFLETATYTEQEIPGSSTYLLYSEQVVARNKLRTSIPFKAGMANNGTVTRLNRDQIAKYGTTYGVSTVFWFVPYANEGLSGFNAYEFLKDVDLYLPLAEETHYKLTPIEMPAAPDSIINVWTDAELPTQSTVNYFVEAGKQVSINRERIKKLEQEGSAGIEVPVPINKGGTGSTNTIDAAAKLNVPYIGAPDSSIEIPKGADLNAYTTIGATYCISNLLLVGSLKNCPVSVPFSMFVSSALGATVIRQTLLVFNTSRIFSRVYMSSNSTWSSWEAVGAGIRSIGNGLSLSDAGELSAPEPPASDVDLSKATDTLPLKNGGTGVTSKNALIDAFCLLGLGDHGTIVRLLDSKSVTQPKAPGRWYVPAAISQEMNDTSSLGSKPALLPDGFFVTAEAMVYTGSEYGNAGNNGFRWTVEAPSGIVWVSDSANTAWRCLTPIVRLSISSISDSTAIVPSTFWSDLLGSATRVIDPASTKDIMRVLAPFTIQLSYPTVSSLTWANSWVQVGGIQATTATGTAITGITLAALTKGSSGYTAGLLKEHDDYMLRPIGMPISFNTHVSFANYTGLPALPAIFANM